MSRNLYIATIEGESGKSVVVLGAMEILSRRMKNVGFFRPVIQKRKSRDRDIELIRDRYQLSIPYEATYAFFHDEARELVGKGNLDRLMKEVVGKYKELERRCEFVLCEGTDFTGVASAFELDFNVEIAKHLRSPVLAVINGRDKSIEEMISAVDVARQSFENQGCNILAAVVNRVDPELCREVSHQLRKVSEGKSPVYVLPEQAELSHPTVGEIAEALKGRILHGDPEYLNHSVRDYKVAAMQLPHFLDYISDGTLVITPGDRHDIILGSLSTWLSNSFPNISGLLLTGGLVPEPQVERLLEGLKQSPVPIVSVDTDTYSTAMNISRVRASITARSTRKIEVALGTFEAHVNTAELENRLSLTPSSGITPIMFEYDLIERARSLKRHIVLPEGTEERILRAAEILIRREVVALTLLGDPGEIQRKIASLGLNLKGIRMIDPQHSAMLEEYARIYYELRKHKGISEQVARDVMTDVSYFGTMMVHQGVVDGMVSGSVHTTQHTIRPSFEFIRTRPGVSIVSSVFLMCLADRVLVYGDCAVNPNPNAEELADIAISSAETARTFGIEPRIAMLSYSTGESGKGADVENVRTATRIVKERRPDLKVDGPIQYDAAVDAGVARTKMPESEVAGQATVFIFPDLNTGNNTYKAVQRSAGAVAIGPVLQGLNKPVNDLSRGCTVTDIVNTVAITAIQAQPSDDSS